MKVVLRSDIATLGHAGEVKEVSNGYARNYLIPRGLAVAATAKALNEMSHFRDVATQKLARLGEENRALAEKIAKMEVRFKAKVGEQHRLYGSITNADIAEELSRALGQEIDKHKVDLEEPIKHIGSFSVPIQVAKDLSPVLTIVVEPEPVGPPIVSGGPAESPAEPEPSTKGRRSKRRATSEKKVVDSS